MKFNSLAEIEAAVAALSPLEQSQAYLDQVGDDIRGDQDKVYLSDAQKKYNYADVQALADQIRDSDLQLQSGNKFYDTGNAEINAALYGNDIALNLGTDGTAGFRTPRQFDNNYVAEAFAAIPFATAAWATGGALGNALPGLLGDGALSQVAGSVIKNEATSAIRDAGDFSSNFTGGQTANGAMVDLGETEGPANDGWLDGLLGNSGVSIPIPGLPISLPGNMDIGAIMDIAKATGRSVMDVIRDMGGEDSPEEVSEDDRIGGGGLVLGRDPVGDSEDDPITIDPIGDPVGDSEDDSNVGWEGNIQEPFPGSPPPETVNEGNENWLPSVGSGAAVGAGFGLTLPGLIALQDDPAPTPEYEMWDYIGPDTSYGYESPDYGQVTQKPLYDFARQPSQPTQVGYDPDPRRDFLNVIEQEKKRRQQGLLG